jgi:uncharacterized protein YjdB
LALLLLFLNPLRPFTVRPFTKYISESKMPHAFNNLKKYKLMNAPEKSLPCSPKRPIASVSAPLKLLVLFLSVFLTNVSRAQTGCTAIINTFAGTGTSGYTGNGGAATAAKMNVPFSLQVDGSGNVFIADAGNCVIRKVNASGIISTVAGNGSCGFSGDGGPATSAQLHAAQGIAIDGAGNLYIADRNNNRIRKVNTSGIITTVAGNGTRGYSGDGGAATAAELNYPSGVAVDAIGNLYVADADNHAIRRINAGGMITTIVGIGISGYSGDGGAATAAQLNEPVSIVVDANGNMYIADLGNSTIRKVDTSGIITTFAGTSSAGYSGDWGQATAATLNAPFQIAVDGTGNVFVADWLNNAIRKISTSGIITTVAGSGATTPLGDGGPAAAAGIYHASGVGINAANKLYISDYYHHRIRIVPLCPDLGSPISGITNVCVGSTTSLSDTASGGAWYSSNTAVATVGTSGVVSGISAGTAIMSYTTSGGSAAVAVTVNPLPSAIVGTTYVCIGNNTSLSDTIVGGTWNSSNTLVASISSAGTVSSVAVGTSVISYTIGCGTAVTTVTVGPPATPIGGSTSVICSGGTATFTDGTTGGTWSSSNPVVASIDTATGVMTGVDGGTAFISYTTPGCIATIEVTVNTTPSPITSNVGAPIITTFAGNGSSYGGDGGPATAACLGTPLDHLFMATDGRGNTFIANSGSYDNVRKVSPGGIISLFAGTSMNVRSGDGGPATAASFGSMLGLAADAYGNVYVADSNIRKIDTSGIITSFVTGGGLNPIAADAAGNIYWTDADLKKTSPAGITTTIATGVSSGIGIAVDAAGNVYFTDGGAVYKAHPSGVVDTLIDTSTYYYGDGGPAKTAGLPSIWGLAVDAGGNVYISDGNSEVIRKINSSGIISTVTGAYPYSGVVYAATGDGGPAVNAEVYEPASLATDATGNLYVSTYSMPGTIRKIAYSGAATVCTGTAISLYNSVPAGVWSSSNTAVAAIGSGTGIMTGIAAGTAGITYTSSGCTVTAVATVNASPAAISGAAAACGQSTIALTEGTTGGSWSSSAPALASVDATGNVTTGKAAGTSEISYTMPTGCAVTTVVTVNATPMPISSQGSALGNIITYAGNGSTGAATYGGAATATSVWADRNIVADAAGNIYFRFESGIAKIDTAGVLTHFVDTVDVSYGDENNFTMDPAGNLYFRSSHLLDPAWIIYKVSPSGIMSRYAGTGDTYGASPFYGVYGAGGVATEAGLAGAIGLAADAGGNVYVLDGSSKISKVSPAGIITDFAGNGSSGYSGDGGPATAASIAGETIAADAAGNVYIADQYDAVIRKIDQSGTITTIAGNGTAGYSGDGGPATAASIYPVDLTVDASGNVYYTDFSYAYVVRKIDLSGTISTIAGSSASGYSGDGGPATAATLGGPGGIAVDASGNLYVGDVANAVIRKIFAGSKIVTVCSGSTDTLYDAMSGGTWSSSNSAVAAVGSTGVLTGVSAGTATVSYTLSSGCPAYIQVTVTGASAGAITGLSLVAPGSTITLTETVSGGTWNSSDTSIATVNTSGVVTGVAIGTTTISYAVTGACGTSYATHIVTVNISPILGATSVCQGSAITLSDATSGGTWSSSNTAVATVVSGTGVVTGVAAGTTTISYTVGGASATLVVTVNTLPAAISGTATVSVGFTTTLSDATSGGTWSSSDNTIATAGSSSGIITGVAAGTTTISYTSTAGCVATTVVTVNTSGGGGGSAPVITFVSGTSGSSSSTFTISGSSFSASPSGVAVYFGATRAAVSAASAGTLNVTVPSEATFSPITVTNISSGLTAYSQYPFLPGYNNSAYIANTVHFDPKVDFTSGTQPYSVAIGDIDGDGKADIVAANVGANSISVFRNTASSGSITSGSFASKVDFTTGSQPYGVTIADIDGDGKLDVAVTNNASNTVSVFRNTATSGSITSGSLAAKVDFATGTNPMNVAVNDMDGDGKADLVVANFYSSTVSVFRNTGSSGSITSSSFATKVDFAAGTFPYCVALGDIDGDGKQDIITANNGAASISLLRNTATSGSVTSSSFASKVDFTAGTQPYGIAVADIDGDGKMDVVAVNSASATLSVFRNTASSGTISASSLSAKVDFTTGASPYSVSIGDADGDGKPDIMVANSASATVSVFRNTASSGSISSGSLAAKADYATGSNPKFVAVGDLDGDGKPDMAVASLSSNAVSLLRNNPLQTISGTPAACVGSATTLSDAVTGGTWSSSNTGIATVGATTGVVTGVTSGTANITYSVVSGSTYITVTVTAPPTAITGASSICAGSSITLSNATGGGTWSSSNTSVATTGTSSGIISGVSAGTSVISYSISAGCYVFKTVSVSPAISSISGATSICAGATTTLSNATTGGTWSSSNTGIASVNASTGVVTGITNGTATISYNVACGSATMTITVGGSPSISSLSVYDGYPASSVTVSGANFNPTVSSNIVYFGATQATVSSASSTSLSVSVPDGATFLPVSVENTGCALVAYSQYPFLPTFDNTSYYPDSIRLNSKVDFTANTNPFCVAIGDIDGDGKPDFVVTDYGANKISVYRNTSSGDTITSSSFAAKVDFTTGASPYGLAIGDVDNDGKLDIAVANNASSPPTVSVFRNTATSGTISSSSLAAKVDFGVGAGPIAVAICDLDKDGKADLAVANNGASTVSLLRNIGSSGSITSSSFAAKVDLTAGTHPFGIATGDIDGDGKPDIAVPNQASATVSVFRNTSTPGTIAAGSFAAKADFTTGSQPYGVAIGDIDGDGKPDLAVPNNGAASVSVLRNTTSGATISFAAKVDFTTGSSPYCAALADMNGDGMPDLVIANRASNTVSILKNTASSGSISSSSFAAKKDFATGAAPVSVALGDLDADGRPDVVTPNISANTISVLRNYLRKIGGGRFGGNNNSAGNAVTNIIVIPNPNKGTFLIKGSLAATTDQEVSVEITDMLGQVIYRSTVVAISGQVNEQVQLDNTIANGIYMLTLRSETESKIFHVVVGR